MDRSEKNVEEKLEPGKVYRREDLVCDLVFTDHRIRQLVAQGSLEKITQGLYHYRGTSPRNYSPLTSKSLLEGFLGMGDFLLLPWQEYLSLGLNLTPKFDMHLVYNRKRHGIFRLGEVTFDVRRRSRYPAQITPEFLLVDLLNNMDFFTEDSSRIQRDIRALIHKFDGHGLLKMAQDYGKVSTYKYISSWLTEMQTMLSVRSFKSDELSAAFFGNFHKSAEQPTHD
ncbi:hypothetical protein ACLBKS_12225 [Hylemonella sp. W303a]|uniref:hypothetical protein n=1 Tax=Hylemonella sp. W303a TaxID=3389873 RepID=UPI00396B15D1